jgi:hypothetical protein
MIDPRFMNHLAEPAVLLWMASAFFQTAGFVICKRPHAKIEAIIETTQGKRLEVSSSESNNEAYSLTVAGDSD